MSHFTCLVIGPDYKAQLQPFHEFECTGIDDQYVVDQDRTEEARKTYAEATTPHARNDATGEVICAYDDRFYRDFTPEEQEKLHPLGGSGCGGGLSWTSKDWGDGLGYRAKVHEIPAGWTKISVPTSEVEPFAEFIEGYYGGSVLRHGEERTNDHGFIEVNEAGEVVRFVDRTNPNAHWDWYVIGGRWEGFFPLKHGSTADQVRKGDVDFKRAREEAAQKGALVFDAWARCWSGASHPDPWSAFYERIADGYTIDQARADYHAQPTIQRWNSGEGRHHMRCPVETYGFDRETYVRSCSDHALVPHAIVKDGKWHERGDMGWWGMVSNEKDQGEWDAEVQRLYDDLPDDTILTLVDCHI
jgi:hypothetical protein